MLEQPAHPYTRALLAAVPKLDGGALELPLRNPELPSNRRLPTGCFFRERCPFAAAGCGSRWLGRTKEADADGVNRRGPFVVPW